MDLTFSGAGFMGCYYFGVIDCWKKYIPRDRVNRVAGASAGSLSAAYYLLDLPLDVCLKAVITMIEDIRRRPMGVFDRSNQIVDILPQMLDPLFPEDAHKKVSGRLYVVMTRLKDMKKVIVSEFETKKDLIDALNCSCFIPVWSGNHVSTYKGVKHIDGGFTDNLPVFDEHTIRVCCFAGASDISPYDRAQKELLSATLMNTPVYFTLTNFKRGKKALFPPSANQIVALLERGFQDTKDFILTNDLIQCQTCYSRTKPHEQPIYLKRSPTITPSISPNLSRACSRLNLAPESNVDSNHNDCNKQATKSIECADANHINGNSEQKGHLVIVPKAIAGEDGIAFTEQQRQQPNFNSLLRDKLRKEKRFRKKSKEDSQEQSANLAAENGFSPDSNNNDDTQASGSNGQPPPVVVVVEDADQQAKKENSKSKKAAPTTPAGSPTGKRRSSIRGKKKDKQPAASVPPPAALSEKLLIRRGTIQMDPNEVLQVGKDRFTLVPNPLPSCPPSPNLNRHCKECISLRQEARLDQIDERVKAEVGKFCTTEPMKLKNFKSRLTHPIKWIRQLSSKSSYRFEELSPQATEAGV